MDLFIEIVKNFPKTEKFFSEKTLLEFMQELPEHLDTYNYGIGTMIRLKLLRPKSVLYRKFVENGFTDKDQMAMEIIKEFYTYKHRIK